MTVLTYTNSNFIWLNYIFNIQTVSHPEKLTLNLDNYKTVKRYLLSLPLWAEAMGSRLSPLLGLYKWGHFGLIKMEICSLRDSGNFLFYVQCVQLCCFCSPVTQGEVTDILLATFKEGGATRARYGQHIQCAGYVTSALHQPSEALLRRKGMADKEAEPELRLFHQIPGAIPGV